MDNAAREKLFQQLVRKQRIGMMFARAFAKRRRGLVDRLLVALATRMAPKTPPAEDLCAIRSSTRRRNTPWKS